MLDFISTILMTASIFLTGVYFGLEIAIQRLKHLEEGENQDVKNKK